MIARPIRQAEFGEPIPVTIDDMLNEISNQGPAIPAVMESVQPQLEALDPNLFTTASHIYITGCGDSYFAGLAARYAFARYAGVPTEALEALEFGRYAAEFLPPESLVFGISNSGKATRSVEALVNARLGGAHTVAITGNPGGWLAQEADTILDQSVRLAGKLIGMPSNLTTGADDGKPRRGSFGLVNYLASLTTLYLIAFHTGVVRGRLSEEEADTLRAELRSTAELISETVAFALLPPWPMLNRSKKSTATQFSAPAPAWPPACSTPPRPMNSPASTASPRSWKSGRTSSFSSQGQGRRYSSSHPKAAACPGSGNCCTPHRPWGRAALSLPTKATRSWPRPPT